MHGAFRNADRVIKSMHAIAPLLEPLLPLLRPHKIFYFHLLELTYTENKVARSNFVAESLSYLPDAERQFWMKRINHVFKVYKYSARCLRTQVRNSCILSCADRRAEHGVKFCAVRHRVGEAAYVPARLPCSWVHDDGRIKAVHIIPSVNKHVPPNILYVIFECDAQWAVVPCAGKSSVDF